MRILRKGISNWKEKEKKEIFGKKKCPRCKCKFEFEYKDIYKALSVIQMENYYVDCPHCEKQFIFVTQKDKMDVIKLRYGHGLEGC